jgi:hypothetical protein
MAGVANLASATQKRCKLQRFGAPWRVRGLSPEQPKRDSQGPKSLGFRVIAYEYAYAYAYV